MPNYIRNLMKNEATSEKIEFQQKHTNANDCFKSTDLQFLMFFF